MRLNFSDLKTFFNDRYCVFELEVEDISIFKEGDLVNIATGAYCTVLTSLENGGQVKECRACFKTGLYENEYNAHSAAAICRVKEITGNNLLIEMLYNVSRILHNELFLDGMSIAVVDDALRGSTVTEFNNDIQSKYKFSIGEHSYFLVGRFLESRNEDTFILVNPTEKKFLPVVTKNLSDLQLESDNGNGSKKILCIEKKPQNLCNFSSFQFSLFRGNIQIVDKTVKAQLKTGTLAWIQNGGAKYVKIWDNYAEQEMQLIDEHCSNAGVLEFSAVNVNERGELVFEIKNSAAIPTFQEEVENFGGQVEITTSKGYVFNGQLEPRANKRNEVTVSSDKYVTGSGSIKPGKYGSQVVHDRRRRAASAILTSDAVNPCLAEILDGEKRSYIERTHSEHLMLDEDIIRNIFPNDANERQRQAIEMAINTPDIAIIQGPPGTGKTRVIRAIFSHLQKYDKSKNSETKYLITAYQNDATFNAVEDMTDGFGLPIFIYAREDITAGNHKQLKNWCEERAQAVTEKSNLDKKRERKKSIRQLEYIRNTFTLNCTYQQAKDCLESFLREAKFSLNDIEEEKRFGEKADVVRLAMNKIAAFIRKCDQRIYPKEERLIKYYIMQLPTNSVQIADGKDLIKNIIIYISSDDYYSILLKDEIASLKDVAKKSLLHREDYRRLKDIKIQMALKLKQRSNILPAESENIISQMDKIINFLNEERLATKEEILLDYIDEMQSPTEELAQSIKEYQAINAATHQRTLGKELFLGGELPKFKAVLVDEAARSCPCDLMIPLACSEEKIILVGDEKQLPQFLDANTVARLADELNENEIEDLKKELAGEDGEKKSLFSVSMFEYLIKKVARKFNDRDGINRVVMLDSQYRMPPTLGNFISEQFYGGKLNNGSDFIGKDRKVPDRFKQSYSVIKDLNMVWIDVPKAAGNKEHKIGYSYIREGEIEAIFSVLNKIGDDFINRNEKLRKDDREKIGIITGYSAQRGYIEEKLGNEKWARWRDYIEVGTIDSFQGKEFDIVFLSCVRTGGYGFLDIREQDSDDFKLSRAGKQRTCVAFSRAKKCMIVVWDSNMVSGTNEKAAMEAVPSFVEFYKACRNKRDNVCDVIKWSEL